MADGDKKFGIELGTTADTSGLEKAERALRDVEQAGKDASSSVNPMTDGSQLGGGGGADGIRESTEATKELTEAAGDYRQESEEIARQAADVAEARRRQNERLLEDTRRAAEEERAAVERSRADVAAKAGAVGLLAAAWSATTGAVREQLGALRQLSPEAADQFRSIELGLTALENPFKAAILPVIQQTQDELEELRQATLRAAAAEANYQAAVKRRADEQAQATRDRVQRDLNLELAAIESQNAAYERQKTLLAELRNLDEARARLADANAIANGADPAQVRAAANARSALGQVSESDQRIEDAVKVLDDAIRVAGAMRMKIGELSATFASTSQEVQQASDRAMAADRAVEEAKADLEAVRQQEAVKRETIVIQAQTAMVEGTEDQQRRLADMATQVQQAIRNTDQQLGPINQEGLATLDRILSDSVVTGNESKAAGVAIQQAMSGIQLNTQELVEAGRVGNELIRTLAGQVSELRREQDNLRKLLTTPPRGR